MRNLFLLFVLLGFLITGCTQPSADENKTNATSSPAQTMSRDTCFYNSTDKSLLCGRPFVILKKGNEYDVNPSTELAFCGLAGLVDPKANETYFIYIYEKSDQLIHLDENQSAKAMGNFVVAENECNTTAPVNIPQNLSSD